MPRIIIFIFLVIGLLCLSGIALLYSAQEIITQEYEQKYAGFCGTTNPYPINDPGPGRELFEKNCASCHFGYTQLVGPPLQNLQDRRDMDWLVQWIHDAPALVQSGDSIAVSVYTEYKEFAGYCMPHPSLTEEEIKSILDVFQDD